MRGGDEEFRQFARDRAASLHRTAYFLCGDWHLADDLVQETLAKCFLHWGKVRNSDTPDAYLRRMLVNEVNRQWRRRGAPPSPLGSEPGSEPGTRESGISDPGTSDPARQVTDRVALWQALWTLSPGQRAAVVLRYLEGLSEAETADVLGCSVGTVKSQTARALRALETLFPREESRS